MTTLLAHAQLAAVRFLPLLAQAEEDEGRGYQWSVAIILLCVVLGLLITLRPSKRRTDFKKRAAD